MTPVTPRLASEYEGFEALRLLADKERSGPAALGWDNRRFRRLLGRLGEPQHRMRSTLVAGSKGKGSTALLLASILAAQGRCTGLYTQPHLTRYAERIRIARPPAPEAVPGHGAFGPAARAPLSELPASESRALLHTVLAAAPSPITAFEAATAVAILAFAAAGVTDAVLEVGFGGRLDAAAECEPHLVLFTPMEREHADLLGPGLADIVAHDAALLRYGMACRSVPQPEEVQRLLTARAVAHGVDLQLVRPPEPLADGRLRLITPGGQTLVAACALPGLYQRINAALAIGGAEVLGAATPSAVVAGLAAARWPGRFERFAGHPDWLLDGAHTAGSAQALAAAITEAYPGRPLALVVGMLRDKDVAGVARGLATLGGRVWAVTPTHPRAMAATDVAAAWATALPAGPRVAVAPALRVALAQAAAHVGPHGLCVLTGSLHLIAEARRGFAP